MDFLSISVGAKIYQSIIVRRSMIYKQDALICTPIHGSTIGQFPSLLIDRFKDCSNEFVIYHTQAYFRVGHYICCSTTIER